MTKLNLSSGFFMFALMDPNDLAVNHTCISIIPWLHFSEFWVAFFPVFYSIFIVIHFNTCLPC